VAGSWFEEVDWIWVRKVKQAGALSGEKPSQWRLEAPEACCVTS